MARKPQENTPQEPGAKSAGGHLFIRSVPPTFCRAGMTFTREGVLVDREGLTPAELERLLGEPNLVVRDAPQAQGEEG